MELPKVSSPEDTYPILLERFTVEEDRLLTALRQKYEELSRPFRIRKSVSVMAFILWAVGTFFMVNERAWHPSSLGLGSQISMGFLVSIGGGFVFGVAAGVLVELAYCRRRRQKICDELIAIRNAAPGTWGILRFKLTRIKRAKTAVSPYGWWVNDLVGTITSEDRRRTATRSTPVAT